MRPKTNACTQKTQPGRLNHITAYVCIASVGYVNSKLIAYPDAMFIF